MSRPVASSRDQTRVIRDWAAVNSDQISARGRFPKTVLDAFNAAHRPPEHAHVRPNNLHSTRVTRTALCHLVFRPWSA